MSNNKTEKNTVNRLSRVERLQKELEEAQAKEQEKQVKRIEALDRAILAARANVDKAHARLAKLEDDRAAITGEGADI